MGEQPILTDAGRVAAVVNPVTGEPHLPFDGFRYWVESAYKVHVQFMLRREVVAEQTFYVSPGAVIDFGNLQDGKLPLVRSNP